MEVSTKTGSAHSDPFLQASVTPNVQSDQAARLLAQVRLTAGLGDEFKLDRVTIVNPLLKVIVHRATNFQIVERVTVE